MIIYKITNKINGKVYIGQTIQSIKRRWNEHCGKENYCRLLHRAIQKYGKENFTIERIDHAHSRDELDNKEIFWIKFYDSINRDKGYNLLGGGNKNHTVSDETRKKLSESCKGRKCSEKVKKLLSFLKLGKPKSKESVEKMRQTKIKNGVHKGEKNYSFGRFGKESAVAKSVVNITLNKTFGSVTEAARSVGAKDCSTIVKCCKGKRKRAYGYEWRYAND